ncbi:MAG TPA: helix-turn-helix domain-containing protein [Solirubrobacterales bacterium]|nr:helix-turn-helix domain-containing protein [Solirubrobacterales bacterium]
MAAGPAIQELNRRMRARSGEIEGALLREIPANMNLGSGMRTELLAGLRAGARDGIGYSVEAFELGAAWDSPLPESMAEQARWAARVGLPLEDLLRGYSAANTTISRFVAEECADLPPEALHHAIDVQARVAEALITGFTASYVKETSLLETNSSRQVLARQVERVLDGGAPYPDFPYRMSQWHIAGILIGAGADDHARLLAERLGCSLLIVPRSAEMYWAWWGADRRVPFRRLEEVTLAVSQTISLAAGESLEAIEGFRNSHRQAAFGGEVIARIPERLVRGADAVLFGALLRDEALAEEFVGAQLDELRSLPDWKKLRQTLLAYIGSDGIIASAAETLDLDRQTVKRRLERVERVTERPVHSQRGMIELALRIDDLGPASRRQAPA